MLDERERAALDAEPDRDAVLVLRRADDDAKVPGRAVPGLDRWRSIVEGVIAAHA